MKPISIICFIVLICVSSVFGELRIIDIDIDDFPEVKVEAVDTDSDIEKGEFKLTENENESEIKKIETHPQPLPSKAIVLAFDVSKSIDSKMFEYGKQIANSLIEPNPPADLIAITHFGERTETICQFTQEKDVLLEAISSLKIQSGKTALNDAIYDCLNLLSQVVNVDKKYVIIFSDGKEENSALILEDSINLAKKQKVKVHTVGLADNPKTLIRISKLTDGKHFQASSLRDKLVYNQIFGASEKKYIVTYRSSVKRGQKQKKIKLTMQVKTDKTLKTASKNFQLESIEKTGNWRTIAFVSVGIFGLLLVGFIILRYRKRKEICPNCGRELLPDWEECQFCAQKQEQENWTARLISSSGIEYGVTDNTMVGRADDNDIVLSNPSVSRQHALIKFEDGKHKIFDLGAKNGVLINNQRISESQQLYNGDEIKLGEVSLVYNKMEK